MNISLRGGRVGTETKTERADLQGGWERSGMLGIHHKHKLIVYITSEDYVHYVIAITASEYTRLRVWRRVLCPRSADSHLAVLGHSSLAHRNRCPSKRCIWPHTGDLSTL